MGMELLNGGRLSEYIDQRIKESGRMTDLEASQLMKGILYAVAYIHDNGIIHRDLKPGNIMIEDINDLNSVKLIDFGLGEKKASTQLSNEYCGTPVYMAPEIVNRKA